MAKTPLFSALIRAYRRAIHNAPNQGAPGEGAPGERPLDAPTRRALLRASASLALGAPLATGCGDDTTPSEEDPVVAVVGGGIAGLHCAYRLKEGGVIATVYEAAERAGGRMYSAVGQFPEDKAQLCELGGELIDTGHTTMHALAEEFGLVLDDRTANPPANFKFDTWYVNGVSVPDDVVVTQFTAVAPAIQAQVEAADSDDAAYAMLDETTLDQWIKDNVPIATYPELHAILQNAYRGEYGLENDQQSALNLVYLIGADDPDPFRIFGISDEKFHTHLGNESFPKKLAEGLDADQIQLSHKLVKASKSGEKYELVFETPDGEKKVTADHVVFALPFTMLRTVDLSALGLSAEKQNIVDTLGYGTNAKVMMGFTTRVWKEVHNASGGMTTDLPVQQTWETTVGQEGTHGIITNFLGGDQGLASGAGEAVDWANGVMGDLETIWPGMQAAFTGTAVRMHWPTVKTMMGSYACYKPGQWSFFGLEGAREGNLHFCGEHCSQDWQGYMEGAAETGALVAVELLKDLGKPVSEGAAASLGAKLLYPQACYGAGRYGRLNPFQRRRMIRAILKDALARLDPK